MKRIIIYMISLASIVCLSGCLDDNNNYNYEKVNELVGSISNMEGKYSIASGEVLTINPSFKFSIDTETPDVSYEWLLDGNLILGENKASCTFSFERSGVYEVTYSVIDNKSGVKFSKSANITVRSPFTRGWTILSEGGGGESVLSFVGGSTTSYNIIMYDRTGKPIEVKRDSLVYGSQIFRDVLPGLGSHPKGLFLNAGYATDYGAVYDVSDEVIVMQDRWAELNGKTLERSVYSDEEFRGDLPSAGFNPVSISMTYSAKAMLNEDGYIYWANNSTADDFHACAYVNVPLNNGQKFTGVYPSYKVNKYQTAIPACTADNKIVGLIDANAPKNEKSPVIVESSITSNVAKVTTSIGDEDARFHLGNKKIVTMLPATCFYDKQEWTTERPSWVALLKEDAAYKLMYFCWDITKGVITVRNDKFSELDLPQLAAFTDMAVFNNKRYVVIADGADLWYFQFGQGAVATMKKLHTFDKPIKSLGANDTYCTEYKTGIGVQPEHNGQLGVALEDGTFWIYEVVEKKTGPEELCTEASINQLFPDPTATEPVNNKFDKIVDIVYKYGNIKEFLFFQF